MDGGTVRRAARGTAAPTIGRTSTSPARHLVEEAAAIEAETPAAGPGCRDLSDLAGLDPADRAALAAAVDRLRGLREVFADRVCALLRRHVPGYAVLGPEDIRFSARRFMDIVLTELSALRVPGPALRGALADYASERAARGVPPDVLALAYQWGSRAMLALMDEVGAAVGLPPAVLLAAHDGTWQFTHEAAGIFSRVQRDLALERVQFDAERRAAFAAGVLAGTLPAEHIGDDARLFGLVPQARHVALAARAADDADAEALRLAVAGALRLPADRLLLARVGTVLGFIAPRAPDSVAGHLVAAGPALPLDRLGTGFGEAVLALETARQFAMSGVVRLSGLGPRPLVLADPLTADSLSARHLSALDGAGRSSDEIERTTRVYLECDQDVREVARRLAVHPNTVRYRVSRFQELTDLNLRRTEDLVTSWWLLNRRRA
ncbi:PucR family transcriptional regulator [Streptomyces sp. AM 3-1-1]|uniref:PucR family transcriptional regulator n=1 Tax=Streptomyces sp. AM 3-1-1 TaxID=3028711 RepID=UPI0023B95EEB|nr:PucR family transcriptional regulator [Streptomyces sp. AM 3-1-1]WEH26042.1 helix-turn-helix domain-containing protein [Streptomyces sp. AM 3-1-1]